jgi:hypothetical protein
MSVSVVHLSYTDPAKEVQIGPTFVFSPGNFPRLGAFPNLTPKNANSPHAAGDCGSIGDFFAGKVFRYNEQIDAGFWLGGAHLL